MATLAWSYEWKKGEYKICRFGLCGTLSSRNNFGLVYQILTGHPRFRVGLNKCVGACSNNLWSLIILCHLYCWLNKKGMNLYLEKHTHTHTHIYIYIYMIYDFVWYIMFRYTWQNRSKFVDLKKSNSNLIFLPEAKTGWLVTQLVFCKSTDPT